MFSIFHTRTMLVLMLLITFVLCVIGLNIKWNSKVNSQKPKALLEVPDFVAKDKEALEAAPVITFTEADGDTEEKTITLD